MATLLFCVLAAVAASPTPSPRTGGDALRDFAARRRLTPRSAIEAGGGGSALASRVKLLSYEEVRRGADLVIEGVIQNLLSRNLDVLVKVSATLDDGGHFSDVFEAEGGRKLAANGRAAFRARLPHGVPGTVEIQWIDPVGLSGSIETAGDKVIRQREKRCLEFLAINPNGKGASQSLEVRARSRCEQPIPASHTWFVVIVYDSTGRALAHQYESFDQPIIPGGELRRVVVIPVPAGSHFEVRAYQLR